MFQAKNFNNRQNSVARTFFNSEKDIIQKKYYNFA